MCKIKVEGRISSSNETEFETKSFPEENNLNITKEGKLAKVTNGVVGFFLDVTGPVIATAPGGTYKLTFSKGTITSCFKIAN